MYNRIVFFAWFLFSFSNICFAQCESTAFRDLNINQVQARVFNDGGFFKELEFHPCYAVPKVSGTDTVKNGLFAAGLWMGGFDSGGALHLAAPTYAFSGPEFFPGPVRAPGQAYDCASVMRVPKELINEHAMLGHAGGKVLIFHSGSYTVYDPAIQSQVMFNHQVNKILYKHVELPDGRVLLFGEVQTNFPNPTATMLLDTTNFNNTPGPVLNHFHLRSNALLLSNGKVLISGLFGCETFDAGSNTSSVVAGMGTPRHSHAAVELADGRVFVSGGTSASLGLGVGTTSTELYDPQTNTWTQGPAMTMRRARHAMHRLASGKVLIFGGNVASQELLVEIFDPLSNTISMAGQLTLPAGMTRLVPLPDGRILVTFVETIENYTASEIFDTLSFSSKRLQFLNIGKEAALLQNGNVLIQWDSTEFQHFNPRTDRLVDQPWQRVWKISEQEINTFLTDRANGNLDWSKYPDIKDWPAHGDTTKGEDFYLAPFVDVDQDGLYLPGLAGDYPCITGNEMLWWVFNDVTGTHVASGGRPLGVQVEGSAYAFDCNQHPCLDTVLNYTTYYHFEVINTSSTAYRDFRLGFFTDGDVGNWMDDFAGSDSTLDLAYAYNADSVDEGPEGFGLHPPAIGTLTLNTPDNQGMSVFMDIGLLNDPLGRPQTAQEYYNFLSGRFRDGTLLVNNGQDGYSGTAPGPGTNYFFSGDPGCRGGGAGWTEGAAGNIGREKLYLSAAGPVQFNPGDTLTYDYALVWSRDFTNQEIGSVCKLKSDVLVVRSNWQALNQNCFNLMVNREPVEQSTGEGIRVFPNPNTGSFTVEGRRDQQASFGLFDLYGRRILSGIFSGGKRFEGLPGGVYLLRVHYPDSSFSQKVVVQ